MITRFNADETLTPSIRALSYDPSMGQNLAGQFTTKEIVNMFYCVMMGDHEVKIVDFPNSRFYSLTCKVGNVRLQFHIDNGGIELVSYRKMWS